ncbi:lectin 7-like [Lotus japonicus]|uniref:lectin 7-like n=1 Tax=Lotus japonicus TaxID=34305 RepID=UPI002585FA7F|nr:lectin 7-like [Lotus japonicus]
MGHISYKLFSSSILNQYGTATPHLNSQPLMSLFMILNISFLMLAHNVNSDAFEFPGFRLPNTKYITFEGDAFASDGVLKLTKTAYSAPLPNSAGRASYAEPVRLWDERTGALAAFTTNFIFYVEPASSGSGLRGDGITFFIAPFISKIPQNSTGGFLGLFSEDSAFNAYQNQIVAVEFDSFANTWDPVAVSSHIGIDINSIVSTTTVPWRTGNNLNESIAFATVNYEAITKNLTVLVSQGGQGVPHTTTRLSYVVDLRTILPEWVRVGFSGATGLLVEQHTIYAWDFSIY